jgi:hypothetical protein
MQSSLETRSQTKVLNGFEYKIDGDTVTVTVNKDTRISFSPLETKDLIKHGFPSPETFYDKDVLVKMVKERRVDGVPLKTEPPLNYVSPEMTDNGKTQTVGADFIASTFGITRDEYLKAYRTAQQVYTKDILKI